MKEFCRFDMEQQLLDCWKITNDIRDVYEEIMERDLDRNQVENILLGMEQLYNVKFEKLWRLFEEGVRDGYIR